MAHRPTAHRLMELHPTELRPMAPRPMELHPTELRQLGAPADGTTPPSTTPTPPSVSVSAAVQDSQTVVLSGTVSDDSPGGLTVSFSGAYSGTATTNADGSYSLTATVTASGTVDATVTNAAGVTSDAASATFTLPAAPSLTLSVTMLDQRWVLLSGQVTDANPGGLTVQFTGATTVSAVTNADGSYNVMVEATTLGDIQATVTNSAGQTSAVATATVTSAAPTILNFQIEFQSGNLYCFSGAIEDESPAGLSVVFGGSVDGVQGQTVAVNSDGSFSVTECVTAGESGVVTAQVTDWWGLPSQSVEALV